MERISVAFSATPQVLAGDRDALLGQARDFRRESMGIEHDAVADTVSLGRTTPAAAATACSPSPIPRVWPALAALVADDDVGVLGQPVDDLALALVAPLAAHDESHIRRDR